MDYILKIFHTEKHLKIPTLNHKTPHSSNSLNQTLQNYSYKSSSRINPERCHRSANRLHAGMLVKDIRRLLGMCYQDVTAQFYKKCQKYLMEDWQKSKKKIEQHLNKISYVEQSMQKLTYSEIEQQILNQWKRSPILDQICILWTKTIQNQSFKNMEEFVQTYHTFCQFVGQVVYLYFGSFFNTLEKNVDVIERLTQRTSHLIVTQTAQWRIISKKIFGPLITTALPRSNPHLAKFDTKNLQISELAINLESDHQNLRSTTESIKKFISQRSLLHKINALIQIRASLLKQIKIRQTSLIKSGQIRSYKVLDKDDFISCLVFCIIQGKIPVEEVGASLRETQVLFGNNLERILLGFNCASYFTDIKAVYEYLINWRPEDEQLHEN